MVSTLKVRKSQNQYYTYRSPVRRLAQLRGVLLVPTYVRKFIQVLRFNIDIKPKW